MEDTRILDLFQARDQAALTETDRKYGAKLHCLALRFLGNREDAEECVNDTYLKTWDTIPPQRPEHLFAYLATLCRHFAFGRLDRKNAQKRSARLVELTAELETCLPAPGGESAHSEEALGTLLSDFLKAQKPETRVLFLRRYWYGDSIRDIAQRCGVSESKVKTSLHRTRKKLKTYLEREGITL